MQKHLPDQEENTSSSAGKKFMLPLSACVLAVALTGGTLIYCLKQVTKPPVTDENHPSISNPVTEPSLLETDWTAAASVQTEMTDKIAENITKTTTVSAWIPESHPEYATAENHSGEVSYSEPVTEIPAETTVSEQETITETTTLIQTESSSVTEQTSVSATEPVIEEVTETTGQNEKETYRSVLEQIFYHQCFQEDNFAFLNEADIAENEFAVYDVDLDGTEELVIRWSNTSSESVTGIVYGYDSEGNIYRKLKTTPYLRFYSNGIIEADASRSSGLSGSFWAYTLYQYDESAGVYTEVGYVDAWDKSVADENWYTQEAFPAYADISHSGFVYFIYPSDYDSMAGLSDPLDVTEYQAWHESYLNDSTELSIPFRKLTEANITQVN